MKLRAFIILLLLCAVCLESASKPGAAAETYKSAQYASLKKIDSSKKFDQWLTMYFIHPQPELTAQALLFAEKNGDFDNKDQEPVIFALASRQFAQNPDKIEEWLTALSALKLAHKALIWKALWSTDTEEGRASANKFALQFPEGNRPQVLSATSRKTTPIISMELNPGVLDMLWTSYFLTGNSNYVERIIAALPVLSKDKPDINRVVTASAAHFALVENCRKYPQVLEICRRAKESLPGLTLQIDKVLAGVAKSR